MLGFHVDAERRKPAIVGRAQTLLRDVLRRGQQGVAHLIRRLDPRVLRIDDADEADLRHPVGVCPAVLADQLVNALLVGLAR